MARRSSPASRARRSSTASCAGPRSRWRRGRAARAAAHGSISCSASPDRREVGWYAATTASQTTATAAAASSDRVRASPVALPGPVEDLVAHAAEEVVEPGHRRTFDPGGSPRWPGRRPRSATSARGRSTTATAQWHGRPRAGRRRSGVRAAGPRRAPAAPRGSRPSPRRGGRPPHHPRRVGPGRSRAPERRAVCTCEPPWTRPPRTPAPDPPGCPRGTAGISRG